VRHQAFAPLLLAAVAILVIGAGPAWAREYASDPAPGIEEQVGAVLPTDLTFKDEDGLTVELRKLITRPTLLTLVYFRCPSICSPLMHEVAATLDMMDLRPGQDYDLITVSFDDREGPELARQAKKNLLSRMKRPIDPDSWRFLTGDAANITVLADTVGFRFHKDGKGDFVHAATVVFVDKDGQVVRYLGGLKLLPADVELAIVDTMEGRSRSIMQRIQKLCFAYDPDGKTYVFQVNRIVLFVTLLAVGLFVAYLLIRPKKKRPELSPGEDAAPSAPQRSTP
jgi:protein SCO1/2